MKRTIGLIFVVAIAIFAINFLKTSAPFMPVAGNSMEPELMRGDLIIIESVPPSQVKEGDVIVFNVQNSLQEHYGYPPVVAHRVTKVSTEGGISFRTKGDNTSEDPFTVLAADLRGQVSKQIPYLGYGIFFLQSRQGLIFMVIALLLVFLYLYGNELGRARRQVQREIFSPIIEGNRQGIEVLEHRVQATERALDSFASAMELYAQHLKSHTSAIIGLSEASHELKRSAQQQNEVLARLAEAIEAKKSDNVLDPHRSPDRIAQQLDEEIVTGTVRDESADGINTSLLNKVFQAYRQHYHENNRLWQLKGLPRLKELQDAFFSELKRQGPSEYLKVQTARNGDAIIVKAYITGSMHAKGWISREELVNVSLYLGNTMAREINDRIKGASARGLAFATSLMAVTTIGSTDTQGMGEDGYRVPTP